MPDDLAIEIMQSHAGWSAAVADVDALVERAAGAAWHLVERPEVPGELSLVLADDAAIRALNRAHRGKDAATNVLAFPIGAPSGGGAPWLLGDIVLAFETVRREATRDGKSLEAHLTHLVVHGMLHLLGHDHETAAEAETMEAMEVEALRGLGFPDPYAPVVDAAE